MRYDKNLKIKPITDVQASYLAGIVDGEGSITITKQKHSKAGRLGYCYRPVVHVANTHVEVLKILQSQTGLGRARKFDDARENRKARWQWMIWSNQAKQLISRIRPFLIIKKNQADVFLKFIKIKEGFKTRGRAGLTDFQWIQQHELYDAIRKLNE